jgi:hypothetical protein
MVAVPTVEFGWVGFVALGDGWGAMVMLDRSSVLLVGSVAGKPLGIIVPMKT